MQTLTPELFDRLAGIEADAVISIHIPTHRAGQRTVESPIHLRNCVNEARSLLTRRGMDREQAEHRLRPLMDLTANTDYWQHQREGLALFQYDGTLVEVPVGEVKRPLVHVGDHAHIVPLVSELNASRPFAALVLGGKRVSLYRVEGERIEALTVPDLPEDYGELGKYYEEQKELQLHTGAPQAGTSADQNAVFHGHDPNSGEIRKERLAEFSRMVDSAVDRYLRRTGGMPLVVLSAEPTHTIYHENSKYDKLIAAPAAGNAGHMNDKQILELARRAADPILREPVTHVLDDMKERLGSDGVVFGVEDVLDAAADGRLRCVIGAHDRQVWGSASLDRSPRTVTTHDKREPDDEDLHNLAFLTAHRTGAELFALPEEEMPDGRSLLGLRRF